MRGNLWPSGQFSGNASAFDLLVAFAHAKGLKPGTFGIGFGTAKGSATVWLYAEEVSTSDNIVAIRWDEKRHRFWFSLAHLFRGIPTLRPSARRAVPVTQTRDHEGTECLAIDLQASLVKAVRSAKKSGSPTA